VELHGVAVHAPAPRPDDLLPAPANVTDYARFLGELHHGRIEEVDRQGCRTGEQLEAAIERAHGA
jgi:hypothetical protein